MKPISAHPPPRTFLNNKDMFTHRHAVTDLLDREDTHMGMDMDIIMVDQVRRTMESFSIQSSRVSAACTYRPKYPFLYISRRCC